MPFIHLDLVSNCKILETVFFRREANRCTDGFTDSKDNISMSRCGLVIQYVQYLKM